MTLPFHPKTSDYGGANQQQICLFADVVGSTRLALKLPHDQYAALMTRAVALMLEVLGKHGAQVLPHQGDAVLGLWDEWQVSQALSAAQSLHDQLLKVTLADVGLHSRTPRLQLRIGLASGVVCCGALRDQPSAYGVPLHLARRLCSSALPGETLLCERVASLLPSSAAQPLFTSNLSGFAQPTMLYTALPLSPCLAAAGIGYELTLLSDLKMKIS